MDLKNPPTPGSLIPCPFCIKKKSPKGCKECAGLGALRYVTPSTPCSVAGCPGIVRWKGKCEKHYVTARYMADKAKRLEVDNRLRFQLKPELRDAALSAARRAGVSFSAWIIDLITREVGKDNA